MYKDKLPNRKEHYTVEFFRKAIFQNNQICKYSISLLSVCIVFHFLLSVVLKEDLYKGRFFCTVRSIQ